MKKSKMGIIGILFVILAVVAVSGCLGGDDTGTSGGSNDGFTVTKSSTDSGDVYYYTFDSGNELTIVVLNQDSMDAMASVGTEASEYGSGIYEYSSYLWVETNGGKTASIMSYESCTTDEVKKAIADIKSKT